MCVQTAEALTKEEYENQVGDKVSPQVQVKPSKAPATSPILSLDLKSVSTLFYPSNWDPLLSSKKAAELKFLFKYEGTGPLCFRCASLGHREQACRNAEAKTTPLGTYRSLLGTPPSNDSSTLIRRNIFYPYQSRRSIESSASPLEPRTLMEDLNKVCEDTNKGPEIVTQAADLETEELQRIGASSERNKPPEETNNVQSQAEALPSKNQASQTRAGQNRQQLAILGCTNSETQTHGILPSLHTSLTSKPLLTTPCDTFAELMGSSQPSASSASEARMQMKKKPSAKTTMDQISKPIIRDRPKGPGPMWHRNPADLFPLIIRQQGSSSCDSPPDSLNIADHSSALQSHSHSLQIADTPKIEMPTPASSIFSYSHSTPEETISPSPIVINSNSSTRGTKNTITALIAETSRTKNRHFKRLLSRSPTSRPFKANEQETLETIFGGKRSAAMQHKDMIDDVQEIQKKPKHGPSTEE